MKINLLSRQEFHILSNKCKYQQVFLIMDNDISILRNFVFKMYEQQKDLMPCPLYYTFEFVERDNKKFKVNQPEFYKAYSKIKGQI